MECGKSRHSVAGPGQAWDGAGNGPGNGPGPGTCSSAAGGAAALLVTDAGRWLWQAVHAWMSAAGYGRPCTCGPTAFDQALPDAASQLVDQVIAPRSPG